MIRGPIRTFRDLEVWQAGMDLAVSIYEVVQHLPSSERFELSSQMRRAAVSVPSNVAEGHEHRDSPKTYAKYVRIALGSLAELDTDLELAVRLKLIGPATLEKSLAKMKRTGQLLHGLLRSLRERSTRKTDS
jgi:four helix bundle protein